MKTLRMSGCFATLALSTIVSGQAPDWNTLGNTINTNQWFGAKSNSTVPLKLMHNNNYGIEFWTDTIQRMELWNTRYGTINGFTNRNQNGFVGISNEPLFFQVFYNASGPFSRLHPRHNQDGLTPGTLCWFAVAAVGAAGTTSLSEPLIGMAAA